MPQLLEQQQIRKWLNQRENISLLKKIAAGALPEIRRRKLGGDLFYNTDFVPKNSMHGNGHLSSKKYRTDELLTLLVIFISENRRVHAMILANEPSLIPLLKRSFINHLIDQARKSDSVRKLYKHCQEVFRNSDLFQTLFIRKERLYFARNQPHSSGSPETLFMIEDDIRKIPFPFQLCPSIDHLQVNRRIPLEQTGIHFLEAVSEHTGFPWPSVELNLFITWLRLAVQTGFITESLEFPCHENHWETKQERSLPDTGGTSAEDSTEAIHCAAAFAARLPEMEQMVYYLYHCQGYKHSEVKEILNRPSSPSHQKKRVETMLKEFLLPFEWESLGESFSIFHEQLCHILEKQTVFEKHSRQGRIN